MQQLKEALEKANIKDLVEKDYKERRKIKNRLKSFYKRLKKWLVNRWKNVKFDFGFKFKIDNKQKTANKKSFWFPTLSEIEENYKFIESSKVVTVWDLENISAKYAKKVFKNLEETSKEFYIVKCKPLSKREVKILFPYILYHKIKIITDHNDSDEVIKKILLNKSQNDRFNKFNIISSDSDFVYCSKQVLKAGKKVNFILKNDQKKRVMMLSKISDPNIEIKAV